MNTRIATAILAVLVGFSASPVSAQTLSIKGSNTFGEELAPALIKAFNAKNPDISVELESTSSSAGINELLEGTCDIASSSRPPNEDEIRKAHSRGITIDHHVVGYYGVAVVVHRDNPVQALSDQQVHHIFTGKIANWKEVGGKDEPINIYIRDAAAGTHLGFRELAMGNQPYAKGVKSINSYPEIYDSVGGDLSGIGYVSMNMAHNPAVKAVIVNGIHPSNIAVVEGLYPFARQVRLLTNLDKYSVEARGFIRFVHSRDGQRVVETVGFVPRFATRMDMGGIAF